MASDVSNACQKDSALDSGESIMKPPSRSATMITDKCSITVLARLPGGNTLGARLTGHIRSIAAKASGPLRLNTTQESD